MLCSGEHKVVYIYVQQKCVLTDLEQEIGREQLLRAKGPLTDAAAGVFYRRSGRLKPQLFGQDYPSVGFSGLGEIGL